MASCGWSFALCMGLIAALFSVAVMRPKPRTPAALLHERCNTRLLLQPREDVNVEGSPHTTPPSKLSRDWRPGDNTVLGDKEFDLVVFSATGFTGSLVAKYLASRYDPGVKWAIAGRSKAKLESLMSEFDPVLNFGVGVIVADASDPASLAALVSRTRVVITTAGPYTDYGTMLVAACAGAGVHYADLSGEPFWQRQMVDDYDHVARHTGAKVVIASGYDSVPFDMGALHAIDAYSSSHSHNPSTGSSPTTGSAPPISEVSALVTKSRGWASGGTVASGIKTAKLIMSGAVSSEAVNDPYLLVPQDSGAVVGACRPDVDVSGWGTGARFDSDFGALALPHFMAAINARIVRRSFALRGMRNVTYAEGLSVGALGDMVWWLATKVLKGEFPLQALYPAPGDGPSPEAMRDGSGRVEFVVKSSLSPPQPPLSSSSLPSSSPETKSNKGPFYVRTEVSYVGDPGYNATSKMLAEAGLCLATPSCHLPDPMSTQQQQQQHELSGGIMTASAAMGMGYVRRLEAAENGRFMKFRLLNAGVLAAS